MKYYDHIVKRRHSCRNFDMNRDIEPEKITEVLAYYNNEESVLVEGIKTDLNFYSGDIYEDLGTCVGYNGFCIKSPGYMVLFSEVKEHYIENAGFISQGITLKLTELGMAACWQTINDMDVLNRVLRAPEDMVAACVISFGYRNPADAEMIAPKKSYTDIAFSKKFGRKLDTEYLYRELEDSLRAVAHAQSFANSQPYCLILDDEFVSLVGLPEPDTNESNRMLNYGIVMFNFYAVMSSVRVNAPKWSFEPIDHDLGLPVGAIYIAKCRI